MAICEKCHQDMKSGKSCTVEMIDADGLDYKRIPYAGEGTNRCPDCGVLPGGYHHVWCDSEICPVLCDEPIGECGCCDHEYGKTRGEIFAIAMMQFFGPLIRGEQEAPGMPIKKRRRAR
jgi:hypothetical protein